MLIQKFTYVAGVIPIIKAYVKEVEVMYFICDQLWENLPELYLLLEIPY